MQIKPVGWFEIYVQDMKRAKAFYEAVFSMELEKLEGPDSSFEKRLRALHVLHINFEPTHGFDLHCISPTNTQVAGETSKRSSPNPCDLSPARLGGVHPENLPHVTVRVLHRAAEHEPVLLFWIGVGLPTSF